MEMTEALRRALPNRLTEVGALTVAGIMATPHERHQHERYRKKLGFARVDRRRQRAPIPTQRWRSAKTNARCSASCFCHRSSAKAKGRGRARRRHRTASGMSKPRHRWRAALGARPRSDGSWPCCALAPTPPREPLLRALESPPQAECSDNVGFRDPQRALTALSFEDRKARRLQIERVHDIGMHR